jgi:hypothetical protein
LIALDCSLVAIDAMIEAHTWYSNVTEFASLDSQIEFGPSYQYEYSYREAYGKNITGWGPEDRKALLCRSYRFSPMFS